MSVLDAGGVLPTEHHPKGWRWSRADERIFRLERQIWEERPLTPAEQEDYARWEQDVEHLNTLQRTVEEALRLYVLAPLALVWLAGLALGRGVPIPVRVLSVPAALCLLARRYVLISRGVCTALMGD